MSLEAATQKAVHDALVAGSVLNGRIYDRVPVGASYPYAVVRVEVRDDATTCSNASEVHVTINVFSNAVGSQEAQNAGGLIRSILAPDDPNENLAIAGYLTTVSAFDVAVYRPGGDPLLTEGVLTFTYLVDPSS